MRRRGEHRTAKGYGKGDYVAEWEAPTPQPPPLRTIAWLCWHMGTGGRGLGRADYIIGSHSWTWDDTECSPTAEGGLALLREGATRWRAVFDEVAPEEYAQVGRSAYPWGQTRSCRWPTSCGGRTAK